MRKTFKPILSGRTTNRPGRQKHYNSIRFSGWTINKRSLESMLKDASNYNEDELKRNVRAVISEAEGAAQKLEEYRSILEKLNSTKYTPADIDIALSSLKSFALDQEDIHRP